LKSDVIVVGLEGQRNKIFWVGRTKRAEQNRREEKSAVQRREGRKVQRRGGKGEECRS